MSPGPVGPQSASPAPLNVEQAVRDRYSAASRRAEAALCCAVSYPAELLAVIPAEIIERDYGCGDPSRWLARGETVLDLGSGTGKIAYIAAQVVGPAGRVIGVDMTDDMLALARKHQATVGDALGYHNVEFRKGRIQDLALDMELFAAYLADHPVRSLDDWLAAEAYADLLRRTQPMVPDGSVDCVVSNCVLNLVRQDDRLRLFAEIFRVLKPGGRAVVSDITSDRPVPERLRQDPELWSGCVSGAFTEDEFAAAFVRAGFDVPEIVDRQNQPWTTIDGIEFRSLTVRARKPLELIVLSTAAGQVRLSSPPAPLPGEGPCCSGPNCC